MVKTYVATLPNGETLTRKTERTYTYAAVAIAQDGHIMDSGFSRFQDGAIKKAASLRSRYAKYSATVHIIPCVEKPKRIKKEAQR